MRTRSLLLAAAAVCCTGCGTTKPSATATATPTATTSGESTVAYARRPWHGRPVAGLRMVYVPMVVGSRDTEYFVYLKTNERLGRRAAVTVDGGQSGLGIRLMERSEGYCYFADVDLPQITQHKALGDEVTVRLYAHPGARALRAVVPLTPPLERETTRQTFHGPLTTIDTSGYAEALRCEDPGPPPPPS